VAAYYLNLIATTVCQLPL